MSLLMGELMAQRELREAENSFLYLKKMQSSKTSDEILFLRPTLSLWIYLLLVCTRPTLVLINFSERMRKLSLSSSKRAGRKLVEVTRMEDQQHFSLLLLWLTTDRKVFFLPAAIDSQLWVKVAQVELSWYSRRICMCQFLYLIVLTLILFQTKNAHLSFGILQSLQKFQFFEVQGNSSIRCYNQSIQLMSFLSLSELIKGVAGHPLAEHQIKGKRIRKQLDLLLTYHNEKLTFKKYQLCSYGLSFHVETQYEHKIFDFEVLLDSQYPFNCPQVLYQHENSPSAFGQNLLESLLQGAKWGPSLLLSSIFDKLNDLARYLYEEKESIIASYHLNYIYEEELLNRYKVELFRVDQYTWKYMIKSTAKRQEFAKARVIGLTKETFLKFVEQDGKLRLELIIKIKDIKEANASISAGRFKLDIVSNEENSKIKYYFGGDEGDLEKVLYFLNPIQTVEKRLSKEKENYKPEELQQAIKEYSDLIEYYSLRDEQKTKIYLGKIQKLIKSNYQNQKGEQKIQKVAPELKT